MDLTKRWFLLGTTAALVAPALPSIVRSETTLIRLSSRFDFRAIREFMFSTSIHDTGSSRCRIFQPGAGCTVHDIAIGPGGCYRYVALPGREWLSTSAAPIVVEFVPAASCDSIHLVYNVDRDAATIARREYDRVKACPACHGTGYGTNTVIYVPTNGMDEWEGEETIFEPCSTCGGIDYRIARGRMFIESFQFGLNGEPPPEGEPAPLDASDSDWKQAA